MKTNIAFKLFLVLCFSLTKVFGYDDQIEVTSLFENLKKFKKSNDICTLKIEKGATYISFSTKTITFLPFVFILPNSKLDEMYKKGNMKQINECKLENQAINCKSEEAGEMPEHNTQSYQHLELKLDKNGDIVDMHAYKIQKRFLLNKELKMFEKKYSEFYCPPRDHLTKEDAINNLKGAKDREQVYKGASKTENDLSLPK